MKAFVFGDDGAIQRLGTTPARIRDVLLRVADGTDVSDLVVAAYVRSADEQWGGRASASSWLTADNFCPTRGRWADMSCFGAPGDLPARFKLIRMRLGLCKVHYPRRGSDGYGWEWRWETVEDHLASLFAHELFHFRRAYLGFHRRGGEAATNRWALEKAHELGFCVEGRPANMHKARRRRKKPTKLVRLASKPKILARLKMTAAHLGPGDLRLLADWCDARRRDLMQRYAEQLRAEHLTKMCALGLGAKVVISQGHDGEYDGQVAVVSRKPSRRANWLLVLTQDGKRWRFPMEYLKAARIDTQPAQPETGTPIQ